MTAKFGTSGLRGLVEELAGPVAIQYVRGFADHVIAAGHVTKPGAVYVGWDLRPSSPAIVADVARALVSTGFKPVLVGPVPTPALASFAMAQSAPSIMVTGSHIPADRNGIKFYLPSGEITKRDEAQISAVAEKMSGPSIADAPLAVEAAWLGDVETDFLKRVALIAPRASLAGQKIGLFEHSAVGRDLLRRAMEQAGAHVTSLGRSEVFVPLDTEDVSADVRLQIRKWCHAQRFDALVSTDGDSDRPLIADETGQLVRGDALGILTARALKATTIATPVTSTSGIESALEARVVRTRVGSPYVIQAMLDARQGGADRVAGFEANGGFLTASAFPVPGGALTPFPSRDAFLPILLTLGRLAEARVPLSSLVSELALPVSLSTRLEGIAKIDSERAITDMRENPHRLAVLGALKGRSVIDGLKLTFADQRTLHVRPSGNAPELRFYVEAPDEAGAKVLLNDSLKLVKQLLS